MEEAREEPANIGSPSSPTVGEAMAPVRIAPPIVPGDMRVQSARPAKWPGVLAIICIVIGAGGVLVGGWGVAQNLFLSSLMTSMATPMPMGAAMQKWGVPMAVLSGLGALIALGLLAGGILMLRRRAACRAVLYVWAACRLAQGWIFAVAVGLMQTEQMQATMAAATATGAAGKAGAAGATAGSAPAAAAAGPPPGMMDALGLLMGIGTGVIYAIWVAVLPVFMLVWFRRARVRRDMQTWDGGSGAGAQS